MGICFDVVQSRYQKVFFLNVWWHDATLFVYFSYFFITYIHSFIHSITFIQYIYPSPFAEASLHFLIACLLSGETPPCGAEARIELKPALQQVGTQTLPYGTDHAPIRPSPLILLKMTQPSHALSANTLRKATYPLQVCVTGMGGAYSNNGKQKDDNIFTRKILPLQPFCCKVFY